VVGVGQQLQPVSVPGASWKSTSVCRSGSGRSAPVSLMPDAGVKRFGDDREVCSEARAPAATR